MMLHPEIQRKAQAELDRVVGRDRLPSLADRQNLPYITAIYREGMRYIETCFTLLHANCGLSDGVQLVPWVSLLSCLE